jgi:predicted transposase YdaD
MPEPFDATLKDLVATYPQVMRLWQYPVEAVLTGGIGTLPLVPLCDLGATALPEVVRRMDERIAHEAPAGASPDLWTSTYILMGLRYPPELAAQLLQGVRAMRESATYQAILEEGRSEGRVEGRVEEARRFLLLLGENQYGTPDAATRATLETITELERLERLARRLLEVSSWEELLAPEEDTS